MLILLSFCLIFSFISYYFINLVSILSTNLFKVSFCISTHTDFILFINSTISSVGDFWLETFLARISHRFSIGFRLKFKAGHDNSSIPKSWNHFFVVVAVWIGALSYWKSVLLSCISVMKSPNIHSIAFLLWKQFLLTYSAKISNFFEILKK